MKRKSFMRKLMESYLIAVLAPLLVLLGLMMWNAWAQAERETRSRLDAAASLASAQFDSLFDMMEFVSLDVMCDESFIESAKGLTYSGNSLYEEIRYYQQAAASVCSYSYIESFYTLCFFNQEGNFITSRYYNNEYDYGYRLPEKAWESLWWLERAKESAGKTVLLPVSEEAVPQMEGEFLTLARAVRDPGEIVGYLTVQIRLEDLSYIFSIEELSDSEIMVVREGEIIYSTERFPAERCGEGGAEIRLEGLETDWFTAEAENPENGICVVTAAPKALVSQAVAKAMATLVLEGMLILLLTTGVILLFARRLSAPFVALKEEMQSTTLENLNFVGGRKIYERYSETSYLYEAFVRMRQRLDGMISQEIAMKTLHMRGLLQSLQRQINPHFLYNTLNIIGIMGEESGQTQIYDACLKLSGLLRYSIGKNERGLSTMGEEFEHIRLYLELMKLRYEERIEYEISCEERLKGEPVLRLILEPFAENIFEHAFDAEHTRLKIRICGTVREGRWLVVLEDDGAGMKEEELELLRSRVKSSCETAWKSGKQEYRGIGVGNTILRMYLFYEGAFWYQIENRRDGGFRIRLSAGCRKERQDEDDSGIDCGG